MAHYAFLDANNVVVEVITGRDEGDTTGGITDWEAWYASQREGLTCKRTSYNTQAGVHQFGGTPFRKNYAGIGFVYDAVRDAFIAPQTHASWTLNETTCQWEAPQPYPTDGGYYIWSEEQLSWITP